MEYTWTDLDKTLHNLNPLQKKLLVKNIKELPGQNNVEPGLALYLWLADLLAGLKLCEFEVLQYILQELEGGIKQAGENLFYAFEKDKDNIPLLAISVVDRTWLIFSNNTNFFNLKDGSIIDGLKTLPFEQLSYNMGILFWNKWQELQGSNKNGKESIASENPGMPDKSKHVCDSSPRDLNRHLRDRGIKLGTENNSRRTRR